MDKLLSLCKISLCSIFLFAYTIISLPLIAGQAVVAGEHKQINEFTDFLDRRIPALMESYAIPGVAIALIDQGEIAWVKAYGHADLEEI